MKAEPAVIIGYRQKTWKLKTLRGNGATIHSKDVEWCRDNRNAEIFSPKIFEENLGDMTAWLEDDESSDGVKMDEVVGAVDRSQPWLNDDELLEKLMKYVQVADGDRLYEHETVFGICARFNKTRQELVDLALSEEKRVISDGIGKTKRLSIIDMVNSVRDAGAITGLHVEHAVADLLR